ncbi:MAG: hypothetical protein SX243_22095 [Acidobacteriota bacterium]|nr:hypothetical protein [Acidobacteriota bacterium]
MGSSTPRGPQLAKALLWTWLALGWISAEASESDRKGELSTREKLRQEIPGEVPSLPALPLQQELALPQGTEPQLVLTIHGHSGSPYEESVLSIWRRTEEGFREVETLRASIFGARTFRWHSHLFLHLLVSEPAAGHTWTTEYLHYVAPDFTLHEVPMGFPRRCSDDAEDRGTPHNLGEGVELGGYGIDLFLEDDDLRFEGLIWRPGEPMHFPSGGSFHGVLEITGEPGLDAATGLYHPTFRLRIAECTIERNKP